MLKRYCVLSGLLLVGYLYPVIGSALMYRCTAASGLLEFRDQPCKTSLERELVVPDGDDTRGLVWTAAPKSENNNKIAQALEIAERKRLRKEAQLKKKNEKELLKRKRCEMRCQQTEEKIRIIQAQLRSGCKLRRLKRLKEQLNHFEVMRTRYCARG